MTEIESFAKGSNNNATIARLNPNVTTLSDEQETIMSVLALTSSTLSILGSLTIIYRIYYKRIYSGLTPYDRIMVGLSSCDIVASVCFGWGPLFLPRESSPRAWALGNDRTCKALGFLTQFAFAAVVYNLLLSIYYLMIIRFGVKRKTFAEKYEKYMHLLCVGYFLATSVIGILIELYGELSITQGCWIGEFPEGCQALGTCRGTMVGWIYGGIPFIVTFLGLPINNIVIFCFVRKQLGGEVAREERRLRVREVATQGLLYVCCFYITYTPAFIIRVFEGLGMSAEKEANIYPVLVLNSILLPLQGFLNVFIYTRPNYVRVRKAYPEHGRAWAIRWCLVESEIPSLSEGKSLYSTPATAVGKGGPNSKNSSNQSFKSQNGRSNGGSLETGQPQSTKALDIVPEDSREEQDSEHLGLSSRRNFVESELQIFDRDGGMSAVEEEAVSSSLSSVDPVSRSLGPLRVSMDGSVS